MSLDYEGLLKLSREEAARDISNRYADADTLYVDSERRRIVVKRFLERICPIRVEEAM
jgi:hypothetical protein